MDGFDILLGENKILSGMFSVNTRKSEELCSDDKGKLSPINNSVTKFREEFSIRKKTSNYSRLKDVYFNEYTGSPLYGELELKERGKREAKN